MNMSRPEVSIIVPVFNVEAYVRECIDSILSQSYTDWELILVDDGSTDSSGKICDSYVSADHRVKVFHKENGGLSSARNFGIDNSTGKLIFFIDSDDVLHKDALNHLISVKDKTQCDIAVAAYVHSDKYQFTEHGEPNISVYGFEDILTKILYQSASFDNCACNKLYSRRLFDGLRFRHVWLEDLDIFYRLYEKAERIAVSDQITYFYRKHSDSFIYRWSEGRCDIIDVVNRMYDYISINHPGLIKAVRHRQFSAYFNVFCGLSDNGMADHPLFDYTWKNIRRLRAEILFDPKSRLKNRLGALLSYMGKQSVIILSRCISKY